MSQKYPVLKVRSKNPDEAPTGANVIAELDGVPLNYASFIKVELHARRVHKVLIELYAHVDLEVMGDIHTKMIDLVPKK